MYKHFTLSQNKGFTLIEVMVSVSIFAAVITIGLAALLSINTAYVNARTQQVVMDDLNFALETMSRQIRVGHSYYCGSSRGQIATEDKDGFNTGDCLKGSALSFVWEDAHLAYFLEEEEGIGVITQLQDDNISPMTPTDVDIQSFDIQVHGSEPGDPYQPIVTISISGSMVVRQQEETFTYQTSITQRRPDFFEVTASTDDP